MGLLLLFLSLGIFEELLNNTGYITRVLFLSDFSEPLGLAFAPLFYLYVRHCLDPQDSIKIWSHLKIAAQWNFIHLNRISQGPIGLQRNPVKYWLEGVGEVDSMTGNERIVVKSCKRRRERKRSQESIPTTMIMMTTASRISPIVCSK